MGKSRRNQINNSPNIFQAPSNSTSKVKYVYDTIKALDELDKLTYENIVHIMEESSTQKIPLEEQARVLKDLLTYKNGDGLPMNAYDRHRLYLTSDKNDYKIGQEETTQATNLYGDSFIVRRIPKSDRHFWSDSVDWFEVNKIVENM